MEIIKNKHRVRLVKAAMGEIPCDLSINDINLINVVTGEIYAASVDILDGIIVRVRKPEERCNLESAQTIPGHGKYLLPGFIDTHMHVESTMMIPENFGYAAICWGTTTAVTDPHEIANVMGINGVKFMVESAKKSPVRILTLAPSCVPAVPSVESAGASFQKEEIEQILNLDDSVIGVAEVMDYNGVIHNDKRMVNIIEAGRSQNGFIQGHAPCVTNRDLDAYLCGGPVSDHEVRVAAELQEKLRKAMHVNIKSSSLSDTVQEFIKGIKDIPYKDFVSLCTDDVHAADLLSTGHINHIVNECIKGGISIIDAIRFGTINAARELHIDDIGIIAPGYVADMQLVSNLRFDTVPDAVWVAGKLQSRYGRYLYPIISTEHSYINTVHIPQITSPADFNIKANNENEEFLVFSASRANMIPNQPAKYRKFPIVNGYVTIDDTDTYQYLAIVNRYGNGGITKVICSDFNLKRGCIASTISHDSHNMTIVYKNVEDAYVAAKALEQHGGGMCYVENGEVKYILPLPVAGLMSPLTAFRLTPEIEEMNKWVMEASDSPMLLAIAILALPVRPGIIITDKGIIRGETLQFIEQRR